VSFGFRSLSVYREQLDYHKGEESLVQHFMNTLTNPFALILRDGATTSRLLRMTGKGRRPLALREGSPVSSPARPEEARRAVSKGEAVVDSPEEYVAILMKHSTK
jgi:hypothetical protein